MANRPLGAGRGLARGLRSIKDRKEREKVRGQEEQAAAAENLFETIKDSETQTLERQEQILAELEKAAQGGAQGEQLKPFGQAAFANLDMHAEFLEELSANGASLGVDMSALSGQRFLDQNTPVIQSAIDASELSG